MQVAQLICSVSALKWTASRPWHRKSNCRPPFSRWRTFKSIQLRLANPEPRIHSQWLPHRLVLLLLITRLPLLHLRADSTRTIHLRPKALQPRSRRLITPCNRSLPRSPDHHRRVYPTIPLPQVVSGLLRTTLPMLQIRCRRHLRST
jgi:hypothetical protein